MIDRNAYIPLLKEITEAINIARINASKAINFSATQLNYDIGSLIVKRQEEFGWGKSIVEKLSKDLKTIFNGTDGFSANNLWLMRQFYLAYKEKSELLKLASQIPWGQNILIIQKEKEEDARKFYLQSTIESAWSRSFLLIQIKSEAYKHYKLEPKQNNFEKALTVHQSEQAENSLKSVYNLDFLGLTAPVLERKLESAMIEKVRNLLMELGYGFCFIGNRYPLKLNTKNYRLDLLFYHRILKCLVVVDIKTVEFEPEFAGKMNYYLELVDEQLKQPDDNPSIGIILCPEKDSIEVEYALRIQNKPIGVAEYRLTKELPETLRGKLPSVDEIRKLIENEMKEE
ncbi:MAG: DUF1016 family protein [Bacteroidetes bacterium]|nr:DUF1016 family protein [Bacteroidota bacterium]